jgi:hypothetical protein
MITVPQYTKALLDAVTKRYDDARKAGTGALRNTLAGLKRNIEGMVSDPTFQALSLVDARQSIGNYLADFDYSTLKEEHKDSASEFSDYLTSLTKAAESQELSDLEKLVK